VQDPSRNVRKAPWLLDALISMPKSSRYPSSYRFRPTVCADDARRFLSVSSESQPRIVARSAIKLDSDLNRLHLKEKQRKTEIRKKGEEQRLEKS